jgi:hypothetical protein
MSVIVECDYPECGMAFVAGKKGEGGWAPSPDIVREFALEGTPWGDFIYVYLPDGWHVDKMRRRCAIHCPGHTVLP